jgi:O-antigen/teichoic acid export membrane protein
MFPISSLYAMLKGIYTKGFFHLLSANLSIGLLGFGSQILVAKLLTPVELSQVRVLQSFVAIAIIASGFGFNVAVLKLCSENRPPDEKSLIFKKNLVYTLYPAACTLCVVFVCARSGLLSPDYIVNRWMPLYMLSIPAWTYTFLGLAYFQAIKEIRLMAGLQIFGRLGALFLILFATFIWGLPGWVTGSMIGAYIVLLPLICFLKKELRSSTVLEGIFSKNFYYGFWGMLTNGLETAGQWLDIFILNYLIEDRVELGLYSLSVIFLFALTQITTTVQGVSTPYFSEKSVDKGEFIRVFFKYEKLMMLLASFVSILAFLVVPLFIRTFYGKNYENAGTYFEILVLKYFFVSLSALLGTAVFGLGKIRYNFITSLLTVICSAVSIYFLSMEYGVAGAAIGQVIGAFVGLILLLISLKRAYSLSFASLS